VGRREGAHGGGSTTVAEEPASLAVLAGPAVDLQKRICHLKLPPFIWQWIEAQILQRAGGLSGARFVYRGGALCLRPRGSFGRLMRPSMMLKLSLTG
jgi:hypothetical protein